VAEERDLKGRHHPQNPRIEVRDIHRIRPLPKVTFSGVGIVREQAAHEDLKLLVEGHG
jgi:hypothetical protein